MEKVFRRLEAFLSQISISNLNYIAMTQIHVVVRRVNPALKIDLAQVGYIKDDQFVPIPLSALMDTPIARFLNSSFISDSLYVDHSEIFELVTTCGSLPHFRVDFFDNTLVLMFDFNLDSDEGTPKEESKRS